MNYVLRTATRTDVAWLEALRRDVYQVLFKATWGKWIEDKHIAHFKAQIERRHIKLIEIDNEPVGMIQVLDSDGCIEIGELQIMPMHQRRGIGGLVLTNTVAAAHKRGIDVRLSLGLHNNGAFRLYSRLGFEEVDRTTTQLSMVCPAPR